MLRFNTLAVAVSLLVATAQVSAQGRVLVADVHGDPGFDFRSAKDAAAAAKDGDAVLIRGGSYHATPFPQVTIAGKSVSLLADPQSPRNQPVFLPVIWVRNIPLGKSVTLRGLRFANLEIRDCEGTVLIEDCQQTNPISYTNFSVKISNARAVTLSECSIHAVDGSGLSITGSTIHLHDSTVLGAHGCDLLTSLPLARPPILIATRCTFEGAPGRAGQILLGQCYRAGWPGGDGVRVWSGTARLIGCTLLGGQAAPARLPCPSYPAGQGVRNIGGTVYQGGRPSVDMRVPDAIREGQILEIEVSGRQGDIAWLIYNRHHEPSFVPGCGAVAPLLSSYGLLPLGALGSTPFKLRVPVQPLVPNWDFDSLVLQTVVSSAGACRLSAPHTLTLLDRRF